MLAQAEAVAADADDVGVVQEAVDEGCDHDLVAERGAPFLAALVGSERRGRSFVPCVDELEEERGAVSRSTPASAGTLRWSWAPSPSFQTLAAYVDHNAHVSRIEPIQFYWCRVRR